MGKAQLGKPPEERTRADWDLEKIADPWAYIEEVNHLALKRVRQAIEKEGGITTDEYNQAKICQTQLKLGSNFYRTEDKPGVVNNWLLVASKEEAVEILKLADSARTQKQITAGAIRITADHPGDDPDRPAVVVSELHSDV